MRAKTLKTLVGAGALVVTLATAGCGADGRSGDVMVIGDYPNSSLSLPLTVAKERGFFDDAGLKIEILDVSSGPDLVSSLIGGSTDIAAEVPENVMPAMKQGEPILALPPYGRMDMNIVVPADSGIDSLEDLVGKKVGVVSRGANSEKFFRAMVEQKGLDADDFTYLAIGGPSVQAAAFDNEAVATTAASTSTIALLKSQGIETKVLASTLQGTAGELGDYALQTFWGTTEAYYKDNSDKIDKFCQAMTKAVDWIGDKKNREAGIDLLADHIKVSKAIATTVWDDINASWSGTVSEEQWAKNAEWVLGDSKDVTFKDSVRTGC